MSTWTLHTGSQSDAQSIKVNWFDHNNVTHESVVEIKIADRDKPRTLVISVDGRVVFCDPSLPQSEVRP